MRHVGGDSDVTMPHGLVDVLVVFDQDSLGPHVLLCPSGKEVKQSQTQKQAPAGENQAGGEHAAAWMGTRTCAGERWSRARGLLSASSPSERRPCGAGRSIAAAAGAA